MANLFSSATAHPAEQDKFDEFYKNVTTVKLDSDNRPELRSPTKQPVSIYFQQVLLLPRNKDSTICPPQGYMPQILPKELHLSGYGYNLVTPTTSEFVNYLLETYTTAHQERKVAPTGSTIGNLHNSLANLLEERSYRLLMGLSNSFYAPFIQTNPSAFVRSGLAVYGDHLFCPQCDFGLTDTLDPSLWPGLHVYHAHHECSVRPSLFGQFDFIGGDQATVTKPYLQQQAKGLKKCLTLLGHGLGRVTFEEVFTVQQEALSPNKALFFNTNGEKARWVGKMYDIYAAMVVDLANISMAPDTPVVKSFKNEIGHHAALASAGLKNVISQNHRVMGNMVNRANLEAVVEHLKPVNEPKVQAETSHPLDQLLF